MGFNACTESSLKGSDPTGSQPLAFPVQPVSLRPLRLLAAAPAAGAACSLEHGFGLDVR